jgi:hypothetical protein
MAVMDTSLIEAEDFLEIVWGDRKGWVDLPAKVGPYWVPYHMLWPADTEVTRRIDSCLRDEESLYFSVAQFRRKGRDYEDMLSSHWLWADLDEVHPSEATDMGIMPTMAWESSPGRYQALWRLHKALRPSAQEKINQALSYHLGADQGGWDRTQVLRLPGTRNFKYPDGPPVNLLWYEDTLQYGARRIWEIVRASAPPKSALPAGQTLPHRTMPARARALLRVPADSVVEGERSSRLWEIECLLAEAGWGEDEIYAVVAASAWNKWAAVRTGERRLRREIAKAIRHVRARVSPPPLEGAEAEDEDSPQTVGSTAEEDEEEKLPWVRYASFMALELPEPKWLIEDIWTANSHGIIGGDPKTSKTGLAMAMCMSVASGKPLFNRYRVHTPGPVLAVQEENAPWMMQDRMRKLARYYGLIGDDEFTEARAPRGSLGKWAVELDFPDDIPLRLLNNWGLDLSEEDHRDALEAAIAEFRPVLLVLDPLYLLFGGIDTDKAYQLYPYLKWLVGLRNEYGCAVALIHHFSKKPTAPGSSRRVAGQRLLGSTTLHGWVDSAVYCEAIEEERAGWVGVRVEPEFRSMAPRKAVDVRLMWGEPGDLDMTAEVSNFDLTGAIVELVREHEKLTAVKAAEILGVDKRTVLGRSRDSDLIVVTGGARGRGHSWTLSMNGHESDDDGEE